jgi:hypothetical protein
MVIADELCLKLEAGSGKHEVMRALQRHLVDLHARGKQVVIFIEEAQGMPLETLEEIRLLSNLETGRHKLLQIVLFGQPELDENLSLRSIRQLRERISHSFELPPLTAGEICSYLNFRMRQVGYRGPDLITARIGRAIARYSDGLIRRVNILADKTLLAAYSSNTHTVKVRHVRHAARDCAFPRFRHARPRLAPGWLLVGGTVTAGLVVAALGTWALLTDGFSPRVSVLAAESEQLASASVANAPMPAEAEMGAVARRTPASVGTEVTARAVPAADSIARPVAAQAADEAEPDDQVAPGAAEKMLRQNRSSPRVRDLVDLDAEGIPRSLTGDGDRWLAAKLREAETWKSEAGSSRVTLQVMTREKGAAHDLVWYLHRYWPLDLERTYVDEFVGRGTRMYRVFYGDFADWQAGREALAGMPEAILKSGPYLRRVPDGGLAATDPGGARGAVGAELLTRVE